MNLYAIATEKIYGELPEQAILYYIAKDKLVVNEILPAKVAEIKGEIENNVKLILDEQFPANPEFKSCRFCSYGDICNEKETSESN